jgi:UDP-N-acetyl-D-glucosamine/UDP-N-acetyl-D-galactosamine dehydrogenase
MKCFSKLVKSNNNGYRQVMKKIAVIGLGYVGLPVAVAFARAGFTTVGFDINAQRIEELKNGHDRTRECEASELNSLHLAYSSAPSALKEANFFIITVPTPIDDANRPDITALKKASTSVGMALKKGDIVVYESTVYPGCTREDCVPILEQVSGLKFNQDFYVGYSPERINPGDKIHRFETIKKITSGSTPQAAEIISQTYGAVVTAGIHQAPSIEVAEAAKVIENTQRDINIGFINELSLIFAKLNIDTSDVLEAAGTKWNFLPFKPGLVGGHCIGVDPYYLTYQSERYGHHAQVILAGRRMNDQMGAHIAKETIKLMLKNALTLKCVTVLGVTFKQNVPDIRNSKVIDIIRELISFGIEVQIADPYADGQEFTHEYGLTLTNFNELKPADALIIAVAHQDYQDKAWCLRTNERVVMDVKGILPRDKTPKDVTLWRM